MVRVTESAGNLPKPPRPKLYKAGRPRCYTPLCNQGICREPLVGVKCRWRGKKGAQEVRAGNLFEPGREFTHYRGREVTLREYYRKKGIREEEVFRDLAQDAHARGEHLAWRTPSGKVVECCNGKRRRGGRA